MNKTKRVLLAFLCGILALGAGVSDAQVDESPEDPPATDDHWGPLRLLEGSWKGAIDGRLGRGTGVRRYEFLFEERYLVARHTSVRLPQEKSPNGDHHRELAVYSFDRERKTIVLREFINEGYVLRHTCDVGEMRFVCETESVESGTGMKARLTIELQDRYRFVETFEIAGRGEELQHYFSNEWTRVPDLAD